MLCFASLKLACHSDTELKILVTTELMLLNIVENLFDLLELRGKSCSIISLNLIFSLEYNMIST